MKGIRSAATSVTIEADRGAVFDHLVEPRTYPEWLVGAQHIRATDGAWPAVGASFHHRVGFGPLTVADETTIVAVDRPNELVLDAKIGPFGAARIRFRLAGSSPTEVRFDEVPASGPVRRIDRTIGQLVLRASIWGRNRASLRRLKTLLEHPNGSEGGG